MQQPADTSQFEWFEQEVPDGSPTSQDIAEGAVQLEVAARQVYALGSGVGPKPERVPVPVDGRVGEPVPEV